MATPPNPYPISPLFSFRWVNENPEIDARYNTRPIDSLVDDGSYAQPWQCGGSDLDPFTHEIVVKDPDKAQIQYINIFPPICKLYTCNDIFVKDIDMVAIDPPIVDTDLVCYNGEVDFAGVDPGRYYVKLTYDSNAPASFKYNVSADVNIPGIVSPDVDGEVLAGDAYTINAYGTDSVAGSNINWVMTENPSPYVDCNLQITKNGVNPPLQVDATNNDEGNFSADYQDTLLVNAFGLASSTATQPKLNLTITKDLVTVFSKTIPYVPGTPIQKTITVGVGNSYFINAYTTDGTPDLPNIDIDVPDEADIHLTVTKNGTKIFENVIPYTTGGIGAGLSKTGIAQSGGVYIVDAVFGVNIAPVTPINIADTTPVTPDTQDWRTSPLDVEIYHPGTLLYEVTNTENDKGAIFVKADGSLLLVNCRVHGMLRSPIPKSDTESYEDQYDDLTQLSSIPSENWTNLIGNAYHNITNFFQIPWWVIQKFNLLYSLNNVLIDGQPFAKISGAEFKPFRVDNQINEDAYWAIDIQPNSSYANARYKTADDSLEGDYVVIYKAKKFTNISADFSMAGIFTVDTNLIKVVLFNDGLDAFTLKIGTTPGGAEIRSYNIKDTIIKNLVDIEFPIDANTTVYFSGLNGTSLRMTVVWDDFLATNIPPAEPVGRWQKDTVYWFTEISGVFEDEFNIATGVGIVGSDHEGCVLAGTNGTPSLTGMVVQGWNRANPSERGTVIGDTDNSIQLSIAQLPENEIDFGTDMKGGSSGVPVLSAQNPTGPTGNKITRNMGGDGDPVDIQNHAMLLPAFYYIGT